MIGKSRRILPLESSVSPQLHETRNCRVFARGLEKSILPQRPRNRRTIERSQVATHKDGSVLESLHFVLLRVARHRVAIDFSNPTADSG